VCDDNHVMTFTISSQTVTAVSLQLYCSLQGDQVKYEMIGAGSGVTVQLPVPDCQPVTSEGPPSCGSQVTEASMYFVGASPGATDPASTTCPDSLNEYQTCQAVCASGEDVAGYIQCFEGSLVGKSVCGVSDSNYTKTQVMLLRGTFTMKASGMLILMAMKHAMSAALGVPESCMTIFWQASPSVRRLAAPHEKSKNYVVKYEVKVPNATSASDISKNIISLGVPESETSSEFTLRLSNTGVHVQGPITAAMPQVAVQTVFADSDSGEEADVQIPAETDPTIGPARKPLPSSKPPPSSVPAEEKGSSVAAIIGGVVGGFFGLSLIASCVVLYIRCNRKGDG